MPRKKKNKGTEAEQLYNFFHTFTPDIGNFQKLVDSVKTMEKSAVKIDNGIGGWKKFHYTDGSTIWYNLLYGNVKL